VTEGEATVPNETKTPTVGRIVHVHHADRCQPAMVVRVWGETTLNLVVFRDGSNDAGDGGTGLELTRWLTSATLADEPGNHWHWPERS